MANILKYKDWVLAALVKLLRSRYGNMWDCVFLEHIVFLENRLRSFQGLQVCGDEVSLSPLPLGKFEPLQKMVVPYVSPVFSFFFSSFFLFF